MLDPLRAYQRGIAYRSADCRPDVRRRAGAPRGTCLRIGVSDPEAPVSAHTLSWRGEPSRRRLRQPAIASAQIGGQATHAECIGAGTFSRSTLAGGGLFFRRPDEQGRVFLELGGQSANISNHLVGPVLDGCEFRDQFRQLVENGCEAALFSRDLRGLTFGRSRQQSLCGRTAATQFDIDGTGEALEFEARL